MAYDAGDRDEGDYDHTEVVRRVNDIWHPSFAPASAPVVASGPTEVGRQRAKEAVREAQLLRAKQKLKADDEEAVRAAFWNRAPERYRQMVCHLAGIDAKKGKGPLMQLSAGDRAKINAEIKRLMRELDTLMRCAEGGKTHDHGEIAAHALNGIVAVGRMQ